MDRKSFMAFKPVYFLWLSGDQYAIYSYIIIAPLGLCTTISAYLKVLTWILKIVVERILFPLKNVEVVNIIGISACSFGSLFFNFIFKLSIKCLTLRYQGFYPPERCGSLRIRKLLAFWLEPKCLLVLCDSGNDFISSWCVGGVLLGSKLHYLIQTSRALPLNSFLPTVIFLHLSLWTWLTASFTKPAELAPQNP